MQRWLLHLLESYDYRINKFGIYNFFLTYITVNQFYQVFNSNLVKFAKRDYFFSVEKSECYFRADWSSTFNTVSGICLTH